MANNSIQLSQLIVRLWQRTQNSLVSWEQLSQAYKYQARIGEFVVFVSGTPGMGMGGRNVSIEVKRLNGSLVAQSGVGPFNTLTTMNVLGQESLTPDASKDLVSLFDYLSTRSPDLDELLKLLS